MITTLALASLLTLGSGPGSLVVCDDSPGGRSDDGLREMYEGGRSYTEFLSHAERRVELWHGNSDGSEAIDMTLVERARAVSGTWRFLAVAVDSCSDSVSTIPYLARLVSMVDGLDMRIVDSTVGRSIMESHPTPDGRAATPTVLLLDADYEEAGCFIERPPKLQRWILEKDGTLSSQDVYEQKMEWYATDAGQDTLEAFVAMLESAGAGSTICR